jgi:SAM-dependent methyltransferase
MIEKSFKPTFLVELTLGEDGIWGEAEPSLDQREEYAFREEVARKEYSDYLLEISKHHSIEVMDKEVGNFLKNIPAGGVICDVGGCWGWHWRNLHIHRPDVSVVIVDFVRTNLNHAKNLLGSVIGKNIHLVHGDATNLSLDSETFDGYWSVQTLQHIPALHLALNEAKRVLKPGGFFVNYSLNDSPLMRIISRFFRKEYVSEGFTNNFYLRRDSLNSIGVYLDHFSSDATVLFSEILFKPELGIRFSGYERSLLGRFDSMLSGSVPFIGLFARQISVHATKPRVSAHRSAYF